LHNARLGAASPSSASGETDYYRHGGSPDSEFKLALKAILAACNDAGLDPHDIEGFASYSDDRSDASRLAAALGTHRLRSATMQWGGGGGGCCAAVANAAAAIVSGLADCVVVFRALAQGQHGRFGQAEGIGIISGESAYLMPYGVLRLIFLRAGDSPTLREKTG
jgi:acetyl-CoA acetyltransferase